MNQNSSHAINTNDVPRERCGHSKPGGHEGRAHGSGNAFMRRVWQSLYKRVRKIVKSARQLDDFKAPAKCITSILLFGNGLLLQLGYRTSSLQIYDCMTKIDPEAYPPLSSKKRKNFEFEQIMRDKTIPQKRQIKEDFCDALVITVGDTGQNVDKALKFVGQFSTIHTLNFDLFTTMLFEKLTAVGTDAGEMKILQRMEGEANTTASSVADDGGVADVSKTLRQDESGAWLMGNSRKTWDDGFVFTKPRNVWVSKVLRNLYYMHGALPISYNDDYTGPDGKTYFMKPGLTRSTWQKYKNDLVAAGEEVLLVLDHDAQQKEAAINAHEYLQTGLNALQTNEGDLYIYGLDISKNTDRHLWDAINNNSKIRNVHVAIDVFDFGVRRKIRKLLPDKMNVFYFDRDL